MSRYLVQFTVKFQSEIDTRNARYYPDAVVQDCVSDRHLAEEMLRFDAEDSDEPIDTWVDQIGDVAVLGALRLVDESNG